MVKMPSCPSDPSSDAPAKCESWTDEDCALSDLVPAEMFQACADLTEDPTERERMYERWSVEGGKRRGDYVRLAEECMDDMFRREGLGIFVGDDEVFDPAEVSEADVEDLHYRIELEKIYSRVADISGMGIRELFESDPERFEDLVERVISERGSLPASDPVEEEASCLDDVGIEAIDIDKVWSESGLTEFIGREELMSILDLIVTNVEESTGKHPMEVHRTDPERFRELVAQVLVKNRVMAGGADPGEYTFYDGEQVTVIDAEVHWRVALGMVLGLVAVCATVWFMPRLFPKKKRRVAFRPPAGHSAIAIGNEETKKQGKRRRQKPQRTRAEVSAASTAASGFDVRGGRGRQGQRRKLSRSERIRISRARRDKSGTSDGPAEASPQELTAVLKEIDARVSPSCGETPELTNESNDERLPADDAESDDHRSTPEQSRERSVSASPSSDRLLRVLTAAEHCLTCPPFEYISWLRSELDVETSDDLVEALIEDISMLSSGEHGGPGIKEGRGDDFRFIVQKYERFLAGLSQATTRLGVDAAVASSSSDGPTSDDESDEASESEPAKRVNVDVDPSLLAVLECCSQYLTCPAYDYATWLVSELDVVSPEDLAEALREDVCLSAFTSSSTGGNGDRGRNVVGVREGAGENFRQAALRLIVADPPPASSFDGGRPGKRAESDQKASLPQCKAETTSDRGWDCPVCTLFNPPGRPSCAACEFVPPSSASSEPSREDLEAAERRRRKREAKKARAAKARAARLAEAKREEEESRRAAEEGRARRLAARRDRESSYTTATETEADSGRMRRMLAEERRKAAAARERKDGKKSRKQERKVAEQEAESARRADHWRDTLAEDSRTVDLIARLIATEVLRQSRVSQNSLNVISRQDLYLISDAARQANLVLFGGLPSRRVRVAGMERHHTDLNGRTGSVRSWDGSRGTFLVGLDTKRSKKGGEERRISPEHLEEIPRSRSDAGERYTVPENRNILTSDGRVLGCGQFDLSRSDVDSLRTVSDVEYALALFRRRRDDIDASLAKERRREERERREEEADRRRRAEDRARKERARSERAEARRRQEQEERSEYERELAELQEARATRRRALVNKMRLRLLLFEAAIAGVPEGTIRGFLEVNGVDYSLFDEDDRDFAG
ncbi:hypothetical protein THAOC_29147, partial [Thalassiosira oceanica]